MNQPAAHRRRADSGPVARLDELFATEEAPLTQPRGPARRPWLVRAGLQTFIASAVVYTALHVVNLGPPYLLILAVCAGGVLVRMAVQATAEPDWLRARDVVRPVRVAGRAGPGAWYEGGDGMLEAVRRWDRRLDWGVGSPERFEFTVAQRLGELADERLRQRHGLTRASDPVKARELLGEELWSVINGGTDRLPSPRMVSSAIRRLEQV